jgi:hypothetical protein
MKAAGNVHAEAAFTVAAGTVATANVAAATVEAARPLHMVKTMVASSNSASATSDEAGLAEKRRHRARFDSHLSRLFFLFRDRRSSLSAERADNVS